MADSRVERLIPMYDYDPQSEAEETVAVVEAAGLVLVDPLSAPYALLTHEYPPTLELAVETLQRLVTINQALHQHLADAWEAGWAAGWFDRDRMEAVTDKPLLPTPNPYKQETSDGV